VPILPRGETGIRSSQRKLGWDGCASSNPQGDKSVQSLSSLHPLRFFSNLPGKGIEKEDQVPITATYGDIEMKKPIHKPARRKPSQTRAGDKDLCGELRKLGDRLNETNERLRVIESDIQHIQKYVGKMNTRTLEPQTLTALPGLHPCEQSDSHPVFKLKCSE
jgi:hypothetical protein